jgi:hypothetical protein
MRLILSRRAVLAAGLMAPTAALAAPKPPPGGRLAFAVFRDGTRVGEHLMTFAGDGEILTVTTDVAMAVKVGPVPVYRYRHHAQERWMGGRFSRLETTTEANGKKTRVLAQRTDAGVVIEAGRPKITAPVSAAPFTHWNAEALSGPMFHPQEGHILKATAARRGRETVALASGQSIAAVRWAIRGEAEIDDWYDDTGAWAALRGKLKDGSTMEYRRL